jgi:hypothetical protein
VYRKVARIYDLLYTGTGIKDYPAESEALHAIIREASPGARTGSITEMDLHHLVRDVEGIDHFVERHRLALVATADYVAAFEAAGLRARVVPFMPSRDRVVGTKSR